jgi:DNA-binding MarR family transcriptional regulator
MDVVNPRETVLTERTQLQLDNFLPSIIRNMAESITSSLAGRYTGDFRLTTTEWRILLQLAEHRALTATKIVEYSAMEKSKVSRALSNLESRDLVISKISEEDHRSKHLALTDRGHKVYRAIVPRVLDWEEELIEGLETSEYRDLLFLLEKVTKRLKSMD